MDINGIFDSMNKKISLSPKDSQKYIDNARVEIIEYINRENYKIFEDIIEKMKPTTEEETSKT